MSDQLKQVEKILKKKVVFIKEFNAPYEKTDNNEIGAFSAYNKACEYLAKRKINIGSMEREKPIGLSDRFNVPKWSNMNLREIEMLDGVLISSNFRSSGKVVLYYNRNLTFSNRLTPIGTYRNGMTLVGYGPKIEQESDERLSFIVQCDCGFIFNKINRYFIKAKKNLCPKCRKNKTEL